MSQARSDIVLGQFGEIVEDLGMALPCSQSTQYVSHRDPHVTDAGAASTLAGQDRDDVPIVHGGIIALIRGQH